MDRIKSSDVASYVVRIYRRAAPLDEHPETFAGLVESVQNNARCAFHSMNELWEILRVPAIRSLACKRNGHPPASHISPRADEDEQ